jgi:hypothetical protein
MPSACYTAVFRKDRHTAVDSLGELGVGLGTENGAITGVGVEERNVVGCTSQRSQQMDIG